MMHPAGLLLRAMTKLARGDTLALLGCCWRAVQYLGLATCMHVQGCCCAQ
jgi:hypothetical protein